MTNKGQDRMVQLDALRGIAAIVVLGYHLNNLFGLTPAFSRGYLFVDFFFLLSGFVLTLAVEPRFAEGLSPTTFFKSRVLRLWPMMAIGALLGATAACATQAPASVAAALVLALGMIPLASGNGLEIFPLNGPQWSIFFELIANLTHGLVLHRMPVRRLAIVVTLAGVGLTVAILRAGSNTMGPVSPGWLIGLPRVMFSYGLGILLGRLWQDGRLRVRCHWWVPFVAIAAMPFAMDALDPIVNVAVGDVSVVVMVMPILFWLAACSASPPVANTALRALGTLSFPLYAVHLPILRLAVGIENSPRSALAAVALCLCLAIVLARTLDPSRIAGSKRRTPREIVTASAPT